MKELNELADKFAYFAGHNDFPEQFSPSDSSTYYYPGMSIDWQDFHPNEEKSLDHKRDGEDFTEEDTDWVDGEDDNEDQDDEKIEEIKKHMRSGKKKKMDVLDPSPFYSRMYSSMTGVEGLYSSPLEYYSGSILNEPGAITNNPYNGVYQSSAMASTQQERMIVRAIILNAFRKC